MTNELRQPAYDADGSPILNDDGSPATWFDVMTRVAQLARENGSRLEVSEDADGELVYRLTDNPAQ